MDRLKEFFASHIKIVPVVFATIVLSGFVASGCYFFYANQRAVLEAPKNIVKDVVEEAKDAAAEIAADPDAEKKVEEFTKNPPKTSSGKISSKSIATSSGTAIVMSTGGSGDESKIQSLAAKPPTSTFAYIDTTGNYPDLGNMLRSYLETQLLKGSELPYLYEVNLIDCATCEYGGYWTGSYVYQGSDIIKAFGYITLNIGPYKNSPYRDDYMKLILSHEYGHHYTMYHRWVDLDIPAGQRFPDAYYSVRPLAYGTTAVDYSLGWGNCDAEIIAEDYSYFYSGYGYSGVAATHGYPSNPATKNYLISLSGSVTSTSEATPTPPAAEPVPPADTTAPVVRITTPANGATVSGGIAVSATASDDKGVSKVDFLIDGQIVLSDSAAPYSINWNTANASDGNHILAARAYDTSGNQAQHEVSIVIKNSQSNDTVKPTVTITEPENNFSWISNNLQIRAVATDNIQVSKIQLYINNNLVAEENGSEIIRIWKSQGVPAGSYVIKARAYDAAGNYADMSITIIRS